MKARRNRVVVGLLAGALIAALLIVAFWLGSLFGHPVNNYYQTTNNYKTVYVTKTVTVDKSTTTVTNNYPAPINVTETETITVTVVNNDKQSVKERKHCKTHTSKNQSNSGMIQNSKYSWAKRVASWDRHMTKQGPGRRLMGVSTTRGSPRVLHRYQSQHPYHHQRGLRGLKSALH